MPGNSDGGACWHLDLTVAKPQCKMYTLANKLNRLSGLKAVGKLSHYVVAYHRTQVSTPNTNFCWVEQGNRFPFFLLIKNTKILFWRGNIYISP